MLVLISDRRNGGFWVLIFMQRNIVLLSEKIKKFFLSGFILWTLCVEFVEPTAWAVANKPLVIRPDDLDYVLLVVNQENRFVRSGETIALYRGDVLSIQSVILMDRTKKVRRLILDPKIAKSVRFSGAKGSLIDLGGRLVDTADFESIQDPTADVDLILRVPSVAGDSGFFKIKILNPTLNYVELTLNERKKMVRNGETIKVKPDDLFKVHQVATNLPREDQIFYQIVQNKEKIFLQFARKNFLFATVTLEMEH